MRTNLRARPDGPTSQPPSSPWARRRWLVAAAGVALLVACTLVLVLRGPAGPAPTAATTPSTSAPSTSAAAAGGVEPAGGASTQPSVCGLPAGDQLVPVTPPEPTDWVLVGTMAAPQAASSTGPGLTRSGLRSCYAHSPLGALYAAAGFLAATTDPALRLPAARDLTAHGQGRDRAVALLATSDPGPGTTGPQVAGFAFLNYDPDTAVVDIALHVRGDAVHLPVTLRWQEGDWKVALPDSGLPFTAIQQLPTLSGYVPWTGA